MYNLKIKNFGVLKDIDIILNKTNLFIGNNGSGKSVLAKVITIVTSFEKYGNNFLNEFSKWDIEFIDNDTYIELIDIENNHSLFTIKDNNINFSKKVQEIISTQNKNNNILKSFSNPQNIDIEYILPKTYISQYIPAERNLISLLNKSIYSLITSEIPLPKHLLTFASHYEKAKNEIKELDLLNMKYLSQNGQDRIYYNTDNFLPLENSSSGMQTALPLYLTLKYFSSKHYHIVIEEPEQNLYPKSQVDTIIYMIENSSQHLSLMTHSPYVLSILNILLFAYKASHKNDILKEKIDAIISPSQQIDPNQFSAYLIENGKSISIKSDTTGMIKENVIDDISDDIDDDFNKLMQIYREYK